METDKPVLSLEFLIDENRALRGVCERHQAEIQRLERAVETIQRLNERLMAENYRLLSGSGINTVLDEYRHWIEVHRAEK